MYYSYGKHWYRVLVQVHHAISYSDNCFGFFFKDLDYWLKGTVTSTLLNSYFVFKLEFLLFAKTLILCQNSSSYYYLEHITSE